MPRRIEAGYGPSQVLSDGGERVRSARADLGLLRRRLCRGALLAAPAALVAVALDLARELVRDQVDRVLDVARGLLRAQGDALEVEGGLGHVALRVRRVALPREPGRAHGQLGKRRAHAR